ncbi:hypothetical protein Marpi_0451 [Marinitoga piezophila KA3]|uniref:Uncharacterized protein n=1 Tax=Marinitoga piezophila (strain DSM 14283 / JCM 11233 / KA3) TaxID=443254 RepID=H2J4V9_MARPK|nr:hypothetical protein Marpi_0451 [Marinitoga piezophila KA3]
MLKRKKHFLKEKKTRSYYEGFDSMTELKDVLLEMKRYQL